MVSRLIHGARISLAVGLLSPLIGIFGGGLLGCLAGYSRGRVDSCIVAAMDIVLAFPGLVLLLMITFYLGASLENLILTLGFLTIPAFCRVARAHTLVLRDLEFVQAARLTGAGHGAILLREIIPNLLIPLGAYGLLVAAFMIMAEGAISFLGLGVPAPTPSWGGMIAEGREVLDEAPHVSMVPAGVMFLTVLAFNVIGDGLRQWKERRGSQI
jgi:peptide/nickel transport system permease protein